jgi:hypothetical protein
VDREPSDSTLKSRHGSILKSAFWILPLVSCLVQVDSIHIMSLKTGNGQRPIHDLYCDIFGGLMCFLELKAKGSHIGIFKVGGCLKVTAATG